MLREPEQIRWVPIHAVCGEPENAPGDVQPNYGEGNGGQPGDGEPGGGEENRLRELFLPPILVEPIGGGRYRALGGDGLLRRYREAGAAQVAAIIRQASELDAQVGRLLTDLSRDALDCFAEAERCRALLDEGGATLPGLARRLGKSQAAVRRKLRLLALPEEARAALRAADLGEAHALLLLRLPSPGAQARLARQAAEQRLTVRQLESLVEGMLRRMPVPPAQGRVKPVIRDHRLYLNAIRDIVEQMQSSGLQARMQTVQGASLTEVRITLPVLKR